MVFKKKNIISTSLTLPDKESTHPLVSDVEFEKFLEPKEVKTEVKVPVEVKAKEMEKSFGLKQHIETPDLISDFTKKSELGWWQRRKLKKHPTTCYIITMMFGNGTISNWVINTTKDTFLYNKKKYHLNKNCGFFDVNLHQYRMIYHEEFVEPVSGVTLDGDESFFAITPSNMDPVLKQERLKILAESNPLTKWIKMVLMFIIIVGLVELLDFLITVAKSGMLKGLGGG